MKKVFLSLIIAFTLGIAQNCWSQSRELIVIDLNENSNTIKSLDSLKKTKIKIERKSIDDSIKVISPIMGTSTCVFLGLNDNKPVNNYESRIVYNCTIQPEINLAHLEDREYYIEFASCYEIITLKILLTTKK